MAGIVGLLALLVVAAWLSEPREPVQDGRALSLWLEELVSPFGERRDPARQAVMRLGTNAVPFLIRALQTPDPAFGSAATGSRKYLPRQLWVWVMRLARPRAGIDRRWPAAVALAALGPAAAPAVPALGNAIHDRDPRVSAAAIEALRMVGPGGLKVVVEAMRTNDVTLLHHLAAAVGRAGPAAAEWAPQLVEVLFEVSPGGRFPVTHALKGLGGAAVPPLAERLHSDQAEIRELAVRTLRALIADDRAALQEVVRMSGSPDPVVRRGTLRVLGAETLWERGAIAGLTRGLADADVEVRRAALAALLEVARRTDRATNALDSVRALAVAAGGLEQVEAKAVQREIEAWLDVGDRTP